MGAFARLCICYTDTLRDTNHWLWYICWENIHLLIQETPSQVLLRMSKRFIIISVFIKLLLFIHKIIISRDPNLNISENKTFYKQMKLFTDEVNQWTAN